MRRHLEHHVDSAKDCLNTYRTVVAAHPPAKTSTVAQEAIGSLYRELALAFYEAESHGEQEYVREAFDAIERDLNQL